MKRIIFVLLLLFVLALPAFAQSLGTPQNLSVSDTGLVTWDAVSGANHYKYTAIVWGTSTVADFGTTSDTSLQLDLSQVPLECMSRSSLSIHLVVAIRRVSWAIFSSEITGCYDGQQSQR